jgi:hypothetical protein
MAVAARRLCRRVRRDRFIMAAEWFFFEREGPGKLRIWDLSPLPCTCAT